MIYRWYRPDNSLHQVGDRSLEASYKPESRTACFIKSFEEYLASIQVHA